MSGARRLGAGALAATGGAWVAHAVPSVCVLGQWLPLPLRALPHGWCRWRGPAVSSVAVTFDDGPSPESTPATLDRLDELGMQATFFVLGCQAAAHPDLVTEIVRRGHTVGSHGYRHEHHLLRSPRWIRDDLADAVAALGAVGVRPRWYRPSFGQLAVSSVREARRHGMDVVLWSRWGHEWSESEPGPVMDRLAGGLEPGAILLLHDTDAVPPAGKAAITHAVLPLLAEALDRRGLRPVTLDALLGGDARGVGAGVSRARRAARP